VIGNVHRRIAATETLAGNWVLDRNEVAAILNNRGEYAAMWAAGTPQPALSKGPDSSQLPTSLPLRDSSSSSLPQLEAQASSPEDVNADRARPVAPEARGYSPTSAGLPAFTSSPAIVPTAGVPTGASTAAPALNGGSESSHLGISPPTSLSSKDPSPRTSPKPGTDAAVELYLLERKIAAWSVVRARNPIYKRRKYGMRYSASKEQYRMIPLLEARIRELESGQPGKLWDGPKFLKGKLTAYEGMNLGIRV